MAVTFDTRTLIQWVFTSAAENFDFDFSAGINGLGVSSDNVNLHIDGVIQVGGGDNVTTYPASSSAFRATCNLQTSVLDVTGLSVDPPDGGYTVTVSDQPGGVFRVTVNPTNYTPDVRVTLRVIASEQESQI